MAGAGVRVFQPGEVLSSTQVNTYLMDQAVCRFATETARDAAFGGSGQPSLSEGRVCYIDSLNIIQYYSGSSWVGISAEAITSVIQAKGDLVIGTALTTAGRVAVGTNGYFLTADSSTATGVAWSPSAIADGTVTQAKLAIGTPQAGFRSVQNPVTTVSGNYIAQLSDLGKLVELNETSACTFTIPTNATVAFSIGDRIDVLQVGTGQVTLTPVFGTVTLNGYEGGLKLNGQWAAATLIKRATNSWVAIGNLTT